MTSFDTTEADVDALRRGDRRRAGPDQLVPEQPLTYAVRRVHGGRRRSAPRDGRPLRWVREAQPWHRGR